MKWFSPVFILLLGGCTAIENVYFGDGSPFDPSPIIEALKSGHIVEGSRNWKEENTYLVKPFEWYKAGGYPESKRKETNAKINGNPGIVVSYPDYRFTYTRYKKSDVTYSFFEDHGFLFAVYEFDWQNQEGKFRFNDEEKMKEYLAQVEIDISNGNPPLTYAIPEKLIPSAKHAQIGTQKIKTKY